MEYYTDGVFWRKPSPQWEIENYGEPVNGKGDIITNTMRRIREQGDTSEWAYASLHACSELLREGKRWPNRMSQDIDAKNRLQWYWSRLMQKLNIRKTVLFRPQKYMTRDPYVHFYALCCMLNERQYIKLLKPPLHLYRPVLWNWRKYLITQNVKYKKRYEFWQVFNLELGMPDFAKDMARIMAEVAESETILNYIDK